jgi:hypothetical protein
LVAAGFAHTGGGTVTAAPAPAPTRAAVAQVLLIGDSVMAGMAQSYGATARATLGARYSFILEAVVCRRLITTSCRSGTSPAPANAIAVLTARAGQYNRALVVGAGYNDPPSGTSGVGAAVDRLVAEARRQGITRVVWLTYREAGDATHVAQYRASNAVLRSKLAQHPELSLADWEARSRSLPSSWFSGDGLHLNSSAATSMADLIADSLDVALRNAPAAPPAPAPPPPPTPTRPAPTAPTAPAPSRRHRPRAATRPLPPVSRRRRSHRRSTRPPLGVSTCLRRSGSSTLAACPAASELGG